MGWISDIGGLGKDLFGGSESKNTTSNANTNTNSSGLQVSQLDIGAEGVKKIIADVLGSAGGIKDIFSDENVAGIFNSSAANQAAGDLSAKLVGEITKLLAKEVVFSADEEDTKSSSSTLESAESGGILGQFGLSFKPNDADKNMEGFKDTADSSFDFIKSLFG